MTTAPTEVSAQREPQLLGQTVVLIGGSSGIGLETARLAHGEDADVVLTGRNPDRLAKAASELGVQRTAAFDATDPAALKRFFDGFPDPIDHVMVTVGGPRYMRLLEMDADEVRDAIGDRIVMALEVARNVVGRMRPGGTLLLMGGTGARRISRDLGIVPAGTAALPAFTAALALEIAPIRVNLIAPRRRRHSLGGLDPRRRT